MSLAGDRRRHDRLKFPKSADSGTPSLSGFLRPKPFARASMPKFDADMTGPCYSTYSLECRAVVPPEGGRHERADANVVSATRPFLRHVEHVSVVASRVGTMPSARSAVAPPCRPESSRAPRAGCAPVSWPPSCWRKDAARPGQSRHFRASAELLGELRLSERRDAERGVEQAGGIVVGLTASILGDPWNPPDRRPQRDRVTRDPSCLSPGSARCTRRSRRSGTW